MFRDLKDSRPFPTLFHNRPLFHNGQFSARVLFGDSGSSTLNSTYNIRTPNDGRPVSTSRLTVFKIRFVPCFNCLAVLVPGTIPSMIIEYSTPSSSSRSSWVIVHGGSSKRVNRKV